MTLPLYYNWRNLFVRKLSTMLTFSVVAVVVLVLAVLLSFVAGIRASLAASGSPRNLIVLNPGATAESTSFIEAEEASRLVQVPGVARDEAGKLLVSPEMCVQTSIPRRGSGGTLANVPVRGVDEVAFAIHDEVRIIEGSTFRPGVLEVIVGKAARDRYADLGIGSEIVLGRLGNRRFRVVGVFEAGGGALESEIWAPRAALADSYHRRFSSSVAMRLNDAASAPEAIAYVNGPTVRLTAKQENDYYEELSTRTQEIVILTTMLVGIMATGAVFAVANTMYATVDGRKREIAMLRTIGFSRQAILLAFVIESLLLCMTACAVGLTGSLVVNGSRQDILSDTTWTVLAFEMRMTPGIVAASLGLAGLVAIVGAFAPAYQASRTGVIQALRKV